VGRDKLRALLLGNSKDDMPEGWGNAGFEDREKGHVDMEVTFMPALSAATAKEDETTLEKYRRKMKEKKMRKNEKARAIANTQGKEDEHDKIKDGFFGDSSDGDDGDDSEGSKRRSQEKGKKGRKSLKGKSEVAERNPSTKEELSLLAAADDPGSQPKHFDMKAVLKAEKKRGKKGKRREETGDKAEGNEVQEDFAIDVKDERFKALHDDYNFAIDPSNPQYEFLCTVLHLNVTDFCSTISFKKTKSMAALLEERTKRQRHQNLDGTGLDDAKTDARGVHEPDLQRLLERVKRKSSVDRGRGKRRRV
jgi:NUC153 domain